MRRSYIETKWYESFSPKSAEVYPSVRNCKEMVVEVQSVYDRSVVYKMFMVRISILEIKLVGEISNVRD